MCVCVCVCDTLNYPWVSADVDSVHDKWWRVSGFQIYPSFVLLLVSAVGNHSRNDVLKLSIREKDIHTSH